MLKSVECFHCKNVEEFSDTLGFREDCSGCGADLHCCKTCEFYDPTAYNECREPSAEVVREKERANFCEFYQPAPAKGGAKGLKNEDLLSAAEALFKKKS